MKKELTDNKKRTDRELTSIREGKALPPPETYVLSGIIVGLAYFFILSRNVMQALSFAIVFVLLSRGIDVLRVKRNIDKESKNGKNHRH